MNRISARLSAVARTDEEGVTVPFADNLVSFSIEGPGKIVASDNGDPTDMKEFYSTKRKTFNGLALAMVRSENGNAGTIILKAESPGFKETKVEISSKEIFTFKE